MSETDELGNGRKTGRSAAGRKIFYGRSKSGEFNLRNDRDEKRRRDDGNFNRNGVNVAVREHRDRAIMVGLVRVVMDELVQRGRGRQRVQQQDNADEQNSQR